MIYGLVFKVMHQLSLPGAVALVVIVLVVVFAWGRSRDRRGFVVLGRLLDSFTVFSLRSHAWASGIQTASRD